MKTIIYFIPLISALIGWMTNWLAVKMIFRPYNEFNVLGFRFQGLIPKRRKELAEKVSEVVGKSLITKEDLEKIFEYSNVSQSITEHFNELFDEKILPKLVSAIPMLSMIPKEIIDKFKNELVSFIQMDFSDVIKEKAAETISKKQIITKIIYEKIESFSVEKLEEIVLSISYREMRAIEYLGGVIGFLIGCIQLGILY